MRWRFPLLTLLALLVACSDTGQDSAAPEKVIYRHSMDGAPASLDPVQATSIYASFMVTNLYDTLFRYKYLARPYAITTNLAEAMPEVSEDGLVYTIRIKQGVHFIDDPAFDNGSGREITAQDFVYSLQRTFDPEMRPRGAWLWQGRIAGLDDWKDNGSDYAEPVAGLSAPDRYTIRIELNAPYPQLIHTLAQSYSAVVPREAVEQYQGEFSNHPVGSGPFRLSSIDNSRAVLLPNDAFRKEPFDLQAEGHSPDNPLQPGMQELQGRSPPFVDELHIEFIAEDAARWNAYLSGDIDFIKVPIAQFDQVMESRRPVVLKPAYADHHFESSLESGFVYTSFNMADDRIGYHPDPERNRRNHALRCAIRNAFNWDSRNEVFYSDLGQVFPGIIPPNAPEFDASTDQSSIRFDLEAGKQLLSEHQWTSENLPELEYGFPSSVTERQMFEQFRSFMTDLGWPHEKIKPLTYATFGDYLRAFSNGEVMVITSSWTMDYPDAENTVQLFYGPNSAPGSNAASYRNDEFDALYAQSSQMLPSPERTRLYREMNQLVIDDCAAISGVSRNLLFMWNPDAVMLPDRSFIGGFFLRFVDKDRRSQDQG